MKLRAVNLRAAAFTPRGLAWEARLGAPVEKPQDVMAWARDAFSQDRALLFIGACGIAVRAIAPLVHSKLTDPAVLVMDELGRHVIPILGGHLGGANQWALEIAGRTGAQPVITTATDLNGLPAIDLWAKEHDCAIQNPQAIKKVSGAALAGEKVGVAITERLMSQAPFPVTLVLRPRTLVLGAGCRRGVAREHFEQCARHFLDRAGVSLLSVRALASIGQKQDEEALTAFARRYQLPFLTYSAQALAAVEGQFAHSQRVLDAVGVDNVCERAAVLAGGRLLLGKTIYQGVTLALAGGIDR